MVRDMDLIRKILLAMEGHERGYAPQPFTLEGHSDEQVCFHVFLMDQAGLLTGMDVTVRGSDSPAMLPLHLNWFGYEFLECARNDGLWQKGKKLFSEQGVGLVLDVLMAWLMAEAKTRLGLP